MRIIALAFLLLGSLTVHAHTEEFQRCLPNSSPRYVSREHSDERIRAIALRVIQKAKLNPTTFSVCEHDGFLPHIVGLIQNNMLVGALILPTYVNMFTDTEAEGLIAHEYAHTRLFGLSISGIRKEVATDAQAGLWVGNDTVATGLRRMILEVERFPAELREPLVEEWTQRIHILHTRTTAQH